MKICPYCTTRTGEYVNLNQTDLQCKTCGKKYFIMYSKNKSIPYLQEYKGNVIVLL